MSTNYTSRLILHQSCIILIIFVICNQKIAYGNESHMQFDMDTPMTICGRRIPETLNMICLKLNGLPVPDKRIKNKPKVLTDSLNDIFTDSDDSNSFEQDNEINDSIWNDLSKNVYYKPRENRAFYLMFGRGIVKECCENSCSIKQLQRYCSVVKT